MPQLSQVETLQHLLDSCSLVNYLWDKFTFCFGQTGRLVGDINNTIRRWPSLPFQCLLLNSIWNLFPVFIYWAIWKECNHRTFKDVVTLNAIKWSNLKRNLQENLALTPWQGSYMPYLPSECLIWKRWNLDLHSTNQQSKNTLKHLDFPLS